MKYKVSLTQAALNDLYAINDYYLAYVNDPVASETLEKIQSAIQSLEHLPERGVVPADLTIAGMRRHRQIVSSVYRIIYCRAGDHVLCRYGDRWTKRCGYRFDTKAVNVAECEL